VPGENAPLLREKEKGAGTFWEKKVKKAETPVFSSG